MEDVSIDGMCGVYYAPMERRETPPRCAEPSAHDTARAGCGPEGDFGASLALADFDTRGLSFEYTRALARADTATINELIDQFETGLDAPICLTWELTYACNLACVHCLSSSGRRDPRELSTAECRAVIDELERMQVFYVNIGGGEPTVRRDFWELVEYATAHHVGVKFSTNGSRIDAERAEWLRGSDYVDVQISLDGATADVNDRVRGVGSYATALRAMELLDGTGFKLSVVVTRENAAQLDDFKALADRVRRDAAADAAAAVGARRRRVGRAASDGGAAARRSTTGCSRTATRC